METITSILAVVAGLLIRLAIPFAITFLVIYFLRKVDARWQSEAQIPVHVEKPKCWEIKGCPPDQVKNCSAGQSPMPCWQASRLPNGYLQEKCLTCEIFRRSPVPA